MEGLIQNRPTSCLRAFLEGATRPSLPALLGALGVAALAFALCVTVITPPLVGGSGYGYFLESPGDEYAYLTSETLRIRYGDAASLSVALIGSSATREALSSAEQLQDLVRNRVGRPVEVYNLASGGLRVWEVVALADCIREKVHGVVVLPVSPQIFSFGPDLLGSFLRHPRLALDSPALDEEVRLAGLETPRHTGNYFIDHYQFFLARPLALLNIVRGPETAAHHETEHWRPPTEKEWETVIGQHQKCWGLYGQNRELNLGVYARLIERLRRNPDIKVALLEAAMNPHAGDLILDTTERKELREAYGRDITELARAYGVPYWDLGQAAQLVPEDFIDVSHIRTSDGRQRFTSALADRLAAMIREEPRAEDPS